MIREAMPHGLSVEPAAADPYAGTVAVDEDDYIITSKSSTVDHIIK